MLHCLLMHDLCKWYITKFRKKKEKDIHMFIQPKLHHNESSLIVLLLFGPIFKMLEQPLLITLTHSTPVGLLPLCTTLFLATWPGIHPSIGSPLWLSFAPPFSRLCESTTSIANQSIANPLGLICGLMTLS